MLTTDWQILRETHIGDRAHGVNDMTEAERFEKLLEATVDQVGGDWAVDVATEGYQLYAQEYGEDEALARVRDSARRIFTVMNQVQLFDNPYSDRERAKEVLNDQAALDFAQEASNKSIVMLKNAGGVIAEGGISGKPKCYIPTKTSGGGGFFGASTPVTASLVLDETMASELFDVVTDTVDDSGEEITVTDLPVDQMAGCEYVFYVIESPNTGAGEPSGGFGPDAPAPDPNAPKYLPISLQYRPYTADTARDPSLAGDILEDGTKENRSYRGQSVTASNEADLDRLLAIREALPDAKIILAVEAGNNAQCFHEIEPAADVILWSWASSGRNFSQAYCRILSGEVEPSGLLPCQMPKDMETVEASLEDVPRDVECYTDGEGNTYDFCFGLNWSGVIDDERTQTYKANPLTEPETEVIPG